VLNKNRLLINLVCITMLLAALPGVVGASELPPRPLLPTKSVGAAIELRTPTTSLSYYTAVEWQDTIGGWHIVDTWQGNLDDFLNTRNNTWIAYKRWWVYPQDFGKQNFRWRVYDKPNGKLLFTSSTFDLPTQNGQDVITTVALP
jgi:hypothetical protein